MLTVVNKSTLVSDDIVKTIVRACAHQLRYHVAPVWGRTPVPIVFSSTAADAAPGSRVLTLLDTIDDPQALGYHTEDRDDIETAVIGCKVILDAPSGAFLAGEMSVSAVTSHEICEWFIDPHCNLWADTWNGEAFAVEVCDPVESDYYDIPVWMPHAQAHAPVSVSDFVLPGWFDPYAGPGETDYLGKVTRPFELAGGGYAVKMVEGNATAVWGEAYPEWRKWLKVRADGRGYRLATRRSRPDADA